MALTTYGYLNPEIGDLSKGANGWMAQLNYDITRLDAHIHDGISSASLPMSNLTPYVHIVSVGSVAIATPTLAKCDAWLVDGAGYSKLITVPAGITDINNYNVKFIVITPAGDVGQTLYLGYVKTTATTFTVYCNDNTASFTALYR